MGIFGAIFVVFFQSKYANRGTVRKPFISFGKKTIEWKFGKL